MANWVIFPRAFLEEYGNFLFVLLSIDLSMRNEKTWAQISICINVSKKTEKNGQTLKTAYSLKLTVKAKQCKIFLCVFHLYSLAASCQSQIQYYRINSEFMKNYQ